MTLKEVPMLCIFRLPWNKDSTAHFARGALVQCADCKEWYHQLCYQIDDVVFYTPTISIYVQNCTMQLYNVTLLYMWYKGQRCRFTQWLDHDLRLRTLQTAGQVDTFSPESFFFFYSYILLTLRNGIWPYTSTCSTA